MNEHIPDIETYIKRLNWYLQEHYPANKKITAEEWNALFLALINQGNAQEDTLAKICNEYLPLQIEKINTLVDTTNEHEASIAQLRTDTNKALKDSNYAVITADTALNQVVEKMGTVAYINNVLAPSLHYTRDPQAQLDDTAQGIINLQSQIDLMEQNTNVADVVGTFVDLVNYDKSKLTANDIVEVLQDETRANADTYYRLVENAWVYIGKLGSYYTRGESDALLAEKVNYADYKDTLSFAENERQKSKNLFDKNLLKKGCYIFVTGQYSYDADYMTSEPISVTPNSIITVSCNGFTFNSNCGFVFFNNGVYVGYLSNGATVATVPANANQVIYDFYKVDITKDDLQYAQLEYGSTATDYQPYYGQITHSGDKEIEFAESERQKSKNLFNINKLSFGYTSGSWSINYNTGTITFVNSGANSTSELRLKDFTDLKAGKTYKLSYAYTGTPSNLFIYLNGSDNTWPNGNTHTITQAELDSGIHMYGSNTETVTLSDIIMVEDGVDIDYQPYYGQITHSGDTVVEFAEKEYQKSKNLFDYCDYLNLATNYEYESNGYHCKKIQLEPNTTYTLSYPIKEETSVILLINRIEEVNGYGYFDTRKTNDTKTYTTNSDGCLYIGVVDSSDGAINDLLSSLNLQIEEGSVATDYQPYYGQITHSGDTVVEFAEKEYQKSKNLLQNTLEGFQLENKSYDLVIYEKNQNVSYPLNFYVKGNTINYPLAPEGALFSFTYSDGSVSYVTGTSFQSDTKQHLNYTFDGSKELEKITLLNWCQCVGTVEFVQLEENDHFTGYQPYNGQISHTGDKEIEFAESERQKSKNLLPFPYYDGYSKATNGITFTVNNDQSISVSGTIIDHNSNAVMWLAMNMPLKAGTYRISDSSPGDDLGIVANIGDSYYSDEFTLSSDATARIYLQVVMGSTKTYNDTVKFMLCEGTDTDWQPYNGEIIHEKKLNEIVNGKYPIDINACTTYDEVYNLLQNATCGQCGIGVEHTNAIKSLLPTFPTNASYVDCVANVIKNKYTASANLYAIRFTGCPFGFNQPIYYCDVFYDGENTIVTGWYKPETVELIYDKDTKNTIGGKPYTAGIKSGTIINHDFSQYKKLILTVYRSNVGAFDYEINLEYLDYSEMYGGAGITYSFQAQDNYFVYSSARISADKQTMVYVKSGYTETFFETMVSTNDVPILRIKGVK